MKELWNSINKFYFYNSVLVLCIFLSVVLMFFVQFKVENLQEKITQSEEEIAFYQDEIQLLEVEWVYLTRPERLRILASRYLQDNGYALVSQIKDSNQMEKFYLANYQKYEESKEELENNEVERISF